MLKIITTIIHAPQLTLRIIVPRCTSSRMYNSVTLTLRVNCVASVLQRPESIYPMTLNRCIIVTLFLEPPSLRWYHVARSLIIPPLLVICAPWSTDCPESPSAALFEDLEAEEFSSKLSQLGEFIV